MNMQARASRPPRATPRPRSVAEAALLERVVVARARRVVAVRGVLRLVAAVLLIGIRHRVAARGEVGAGRVPVPGAASAAERCAHQVQMIYLTDDPFVAAWASQKATDLTLLAPEPETV